MRACIAKRKHEDDGEQRADRADLRPRIDPESGNEQERRGIARPLASKSMTPADAPTSDDSDSDSETYYEESSSDESDEEDSEGDESEKDEPEREIVIGRQPASIVTSYEDAESGATVLRAGSKPNIDMSFGKNSSLLSRVRAFLPELEASNRVLVTESSEGPHSRKLELDDDEALDQPHVEMNIFALEEDSSRTASELKTQPGDEQNEPKISTITTKTTQLRAKIEHSLIQEI